jgi:hypothetical protein
MTVADSGTDGGGRGSSVAVGRAPSNAGLDGGAGALVVANRDRSTGDSLLRIDEDVGYTQTRLQNDCADRCHTKRGRSADQYRYGARRRATTRATGRTGSGADGWRRAAISRFPIRVACKLAIREQKADAQGGLASPGFADLAGAVAVFVGAFNASANLGILNIKWKQHRRPDQFGLHRACHTYRRSGRNDIDSLFCRNFQNRPI